MRLLNGACATLSVAVLMTLAGISNGAAFVNVSILGSTSSGGPYASTLTGVAPGETIFYEVVAQIPASVTNINTTKTPNGTQDSINSLNTYSLSDAGNGVFLTNFESALSTGTGNSAGTVNGNTVTGIRFIGANGVYTNADNPLVIETGTFQVGSTTTSITGSELLTSSGALKIAGTGPTNILGINQTTETSADPLEHISPLQFVQTPEPSTISFVCVTTVGFLTRRRRVPQ